MDRRTFITSTTAAAIGLGTNAILPKLAQGKETMDTPTESFWPDGARLVISVSMQFETGSQPDRGAGSPFPPLDPKNPDLPVGKWYEYGFKEGVPRLLTSTIKARRAGFHDCFDTEDMFSHLFDDLRQKRLIPRLS